MSPSGPSFPVIHHRALTPSFLPGHGIAVLPADSLLLAFFVLVFFQRRKRVRRRRMAWKMLCDLVAQHQYTLAQRKQICLTKDHYGLVNTKRWEQELDYFCKSILLATLKQENLAAFWQPFHRRILQHIAHVTETILQQEQDRINQIPADTAPQKFRANMDPLDYERLCAHLLCKAGWRAQATPPGADQGLDIMAEQDGVRLVVQCKLYNRPVGNKAVQEIFTARQHRQAHYAAVVSNAGYTRSARELAHATGVHLFHHSQLSTLTILDLQPQQDTLWS